MSRGLTGAALSAVTAEVVQRTMAVELLFPGGAVRFTGAPYDMTIDGNAYSGVGVLGSVSAVEEAADLRAYGLTVGLSGIPRDVVALALTEQYQGRRGTVWEVPLDAAGAPIADPVLVFRGRMDVMDVSLGATATITVRMENRLADWERPRVRRYTDEDQQRDYPGDTFFAFVPATAEKELLWPARTFFERQR